MKDQLKSILPTLAVVLVCTLALSIVAFSDLRSKLFGADIFSSPETGFELWYLGETETDRTWNIPTKLGAVFELPLGITTTNASAIAPIDSIEFRLTGVPDFMAFDEVSTFPGFHIDTVERPGQSLMTNDVSIFITPEEYSDPSASLPGAPDADQLGKLITETAEVLRVAFRIAATPTTDTQPISVAAVLVRRDGNFTRYYADANPNLPGNNTGALILAPQFATYPHIVSTRAVTDEIIELDFDTPLLGGMENSGAENTANYSIYACGADIPGSDPNDPNALDAAGCREMNQQSVSNPGTPVLAELDTEDASKIRLTTDIGVSLADEIYYIVLASNIGNSPAEEFLPPEGIFSQPFVWTVHPTIQKAVPKDVGVLNVMFNNALCTTETEADPTDSNNYEIFACNQDIEYAQCIEKNRETAADLMISDAMYDGDRTVALFTDAQTENVYYVVRAINLRDENCLAESAIPAEVGNFSPQFTGFNSLPLNGKLAIGVSESQKIHLPWREEIRLKPTGGMAPYEWVADPVDAGIVEIDPENGDIIFRPTLIDNNNQAVQDERDVTLTLVDANEVTSTISLHILRRGDLGGRSVQLLDKTDIQDVNDIAAGWKR